MPKEKPDAEKAFTPQYLIISKSESRYGLIKKQLLDTSGYPAGASCYFVRVNGDSGCICRIRVGNGTVMFYEVINHEQEGITGGDIREALCDPALACSLAGYFHLTPIIEEKLQNVRLEENHGFSVRQLSRQKEPDRA